MRCPADLTIKELRPQKHNPLHVKQEESEMPSIKQEEEPDTPSINEEDEIPKFTMTVSVKSEEDKGLSNESGAAKSSGDSSFQLLTTKEEGRLQPADVTVEELHLEKHDPPHVKQEESDKAYIKQEAEPETPSIKEEKQEEEIITFPMTVGVKSEEDEGLSGAAKPSSDSSFQHLTTKDITVENLHSEKHDRPHVNQEESDMVYIKQEAEPENPSIKEEKQEEEIPKFPMTVSVKIKDEGPSEESRAVKLASSSLFQHLTTKDITVENLYSEKHYCPNVNQEESDMAYIKQEAEPETTSIKEEKQIEEIPKFPMTVGVKSEEDEGPSGESRAAKLATSSLFQHLTAKGEGQSQPDNFLASLSDTDDVTSHSSDFHTDEEDVDSDPLKSLNKSSQKRDAEESAAGKPLKEHTRTHTGDEPIACSVCNKRFGKKYQLTRHSQTHTGEKHFVCSLCDKKYRIKVHLTRHMRTHTGEKPFLCSLCDKRFCSKHELTRHTRTHTGEKPFVCSLCNKRFFTKQALTRHMRTHTGEKPFVCTICGKRFAEKYQLTRHARTHTGEVLCVLHCR
ncbi:gastrula zinc finger protein 5-1-like isoform X3 [Corythoichthys intestinalis]|uniref:gastrula zinc finger protein 5-1-like isoform X3 n=1 Tax=Corythoichthys intestinalis TaxID=161448 RepID=UPI0025A67E3B|nr:gastrula zinc finger protein 5-1-like isoform X3 [Corythoichthys intestinalis]